MTSVPTEQRPATADADLRGIARAGSISLVGSAASAVLGFMLVVEVSRGLGTAGAGAFSVVVAIAMTLSVAGRFGTDTALVRLEPRFRALGRQRDIDSAAVASLIPVCIGTTVLAVGAWLAAPHLVTLIFDEPPPAGGVWLIRVGVATVPLGAGGYVALAVTRGLGSVVPITVVESIAKPAMRCGFVALAIGGAHVLHPHSAATLVLWTMIAWAAPTVVGGVWSGILAHRALKAVRTNEPGGAEGPARTWRELWRFATPRAIASGCEIAGMHAGIVLVSALAGVADAGVYNAALRVALAGTLALQALRIAIAPTLARLLTIGDTAGVEHLHRTASMWITVVSFPLYLVFTVWPGEVLALFGPGFHAGAVALAILAGATLVNLATGPVSTLLLMSGRSTLTLAVTSISLTGGVALAALLIPHYGVLGAALAKGAAVIGENVAVTLIVRRTVGVRTLSKPLVGAALAGVACYVLPAVVYHLLHRSAHPQFVPAVLVVLLGSVGYLAVLWRWRRSFALAELAAALPTRPHRKKPVPQEDSQ
jgi:O-antigen/teichoic acid export membrane protein